MRVEAIFAQSAKKGWKTPIKILISVSMAGIDETIVREYFETNGFLVRQLNKYQVQSRRKRADEEIDLVVFNPRCASEGGDVGFIPAPSELANIKQAAVSVKGWHTTTFSAATLKSEASIFNFLQKNALKTVESMFPDGGKVFKILALPGLPKGRAERQKSIALLKSKGIDAVLTYPQMLQSIIDGVEANNNYQKSGLLQILRILKNYDMLRPPQMELFDK